jgi:CRP/FNR family cyclic AMP-dependent transcriptional regulator
VSTQLPGKGVFERRFFAKGESIIHKNQDGNCAYLVQSGAVQIYDLGEDKKERELARFGAGQIFGEMALVLDQPRSASVRAIEDTNVIIVSRIAFSKKLDGCDATVKAVTRMMMKRVADTTAALLEKEKENRDIVEEAYNIFTQLRHAVNGIDKSVMDPVSAEKFDEAMKDLSEFLRRNMSK